MWQAQEASALRSSSRTSIRSIRCRCCDSRSRATARQTRCTGSSASSGATVGLPDLPIEWAELVDGLGLPDADRRIAAQEVKDELRRNTDEAIARGVFGVPTLAIGDALFWGADATPMAADYAAAGCRFTDPEYARVAELPVGAEREDLRQGSPLGKRKTRVVGTAS